MRSISITLNLPNINNRHYDKVYRSEETLHMPLSVRQFELYRLTQVKPFSLRVGSQQSNDLKDALDTEMEKTKQMEESMAKVSNYYYNYYCYYYYYYYPVIVNGLHLTAWETVPLHQQFRLLQDHSIRRCGQLALYQQQLQRSCENNQKSSSPQDC